MLNAHGEEREEEDGVMHGILVLGSFFFFCTQASTWNGREQGRGFDAFCMALKLAASRELHALYGVRMRKASR